MVAREVSYRHQLARTGNIPRHPEGLARRRMPWLPEESDALIVDVGCAWGTLLLESRKVGYRNLLGIERDEELAAEASTRCGGSGETIRIIRSDAIAFFENTDLLADRVTLFHVLEQFAQKDGVRLLAAIRARLHPERGQVVIEVPNMSSITGQICSAAIWHTRLRLQNSA
jgi:2-polyprenyl-3-methyl-5-hydroxy-6-metoxy-1,4-benzoquinol methylase